MRYLLALALLGLLVGCDGAETEPEAETETETETESETESEAETGSEAIARTKAAAKKLGGTLKKRLLSAMKEDGPKGAVEMCSTEAQQLTAGVAQDTDVRVGRSSLRLRNPDNEGPPWVAEWLKAQGERKAEGVEGFAKVVDTDGGREARVLKPIAIEGPCLTCHGPKDQLADGVQPVLEERYPKDGATGYAIGDLRGALWAASDVE